MHRRLFAITSIFALIFCLMLWACGTEDDTTDRGSDGDVGGSDGDTEAGAAGASGSWSPPRAA